MHSKWQKAYEKKMEELYGCTMEEWAVRERPVRRFHRRAHKWPLKQRIADFYLLEYMTAEGDDLAGWYFDSLLSEAYPLLLRYLRLVVGGELRHAPAGNNEMNVFSEWDAEVPSKELKNVIIKMTKLGREQAWVLWNEFIRHRTRREVWPWAAKVFPEFRGGVGGDGWASAAKLLHYKYKNQLTPAIFCDQTFTIQHNHGVVLDKMFDVEHIRDYLAAADASNFKWLLLHCSPTTREVWYDKEEARLRKARQTHDPVWLGVQYV